MSYYDDPSDFTESTDVQDLIEHYETHGRNVNVRDVSGRNVISASRILTTYDPGEKIMIFTVKPTLRIKPKYTWSFAIVHDPRGIYDNFNCTDFINSEGDVTKKGWYKLDHDNTLTLSVRVKNGHIPKRYSIDILWVASTDPEYDGHDYVYTPPEYSDYETTDD